MDVALMFKTLSRVALALSLGAVSGSALAQSGEISSQDATKQFVVDLGIGAIVQPRYESADSYLVYPMPIVSVGRFYLPGLGQVVDGRRKSGVFFFPSFNFIGERKASDSSDLTGTNTVDWALELGLGGGAADPRGPRAECCGHQDVCHLAGGGSLVAGRNQTGCRAVGCDPQTARTSGQGKGLRLERGG